MKKRIIEFASNAPQHDLPKPSKLSIPEWYKSNPLHKNGNNLLKEKEIYNTIKKCVPFLDSMTTGYTAELWCDILVRKLENGMSGFEWTTKTGEPIEMREFSSSINLPVPAGHSPQRMAWNLPYYMKTPIGYSSLITHPLNRYDLPFTTLSGVVDTDTVLYAGRLPFFIHQDFEGIIKKGTPIFQVVPFKRDDWQSKENRLLIEEGERKRFKSLAVISGWYKTEVWQRKEYN
jgi:hypothetical protein